MQSEAAPSTNHHPVKGLPPVAPPSGRFIAQLFLVPGLIVTVAVLILMGFSWLVGGESSPDRLLERLSDSNPDVRWRAANEFAQRLKRDPNLATDPKVALKLAETLYKSLDSFARMSGSGPTNDMDAKERKNWHDKRNEVAFLGSCLGNLVLPTGAPLLCEIATKGAGRDAKTQALLRREAVWALANLGEQTKHLADLSPERREAILMALDRATRLAPAEQAEWATLTREFIAGKRTNIGVVQALAECAEADDPFLRELVTLGLSVWQGDAEESALAEKTLLKLSYDDGHGERIEIGDND